MKEICECRITGCSIAINQFMPFLGIYVGLDDEKIWKKNVNVGLTVVPSLSISSCCLWVSTLAWMMWKFERRMWMSDYRLFNRYQSIHAVCVYLRWLEWCENLKEECECRINGCSIAINQFMPFVGMFVSLDVVIIWKKNVNVGLTVVQSLSINSCCLWVFMLAWMMWKFEKRMWIWD